MGIGLATESAEVGYIRNFASECFQRRLPAKSLFRGPVSDVHDCASSFFPKTLRKTSTEKECTGCLEQSPIVAFRFSVLLWRVRCGGPVDDSECLQLIL